MNRADLPDFESVENFGSLENFGNAENDESVKEEKLTEVQKLMMAAGAKLNFECACVIEKIISTVGEKEENYKWLLERLFKSLNPDFNSSGKISQLREWLNFSNQQKSNDDLEMLKLFLDAVTMVESKKKA